MNFFKVALVLIIAQAQFLACSSKKVQEQKTATTSSAVIKPAGLKLPKYYEHTLKNGLRILYLPDKSLPQVYFSAIIKAGAIQDPENIPGLNAMTANLLDEGTKDKTSYQIAERLEFLGASLSIQPGSDFTTMSTQGLSMSKSELWSYFYEILTKPAFPESELKRVAAQTVAGLSKLTDEPESYVSSLYDQVIYKGNAYSYPVVGKIKSIKAIKRSDVLRHYLRYYRPNNTLLAVVGDFDANFEKAIEAQLSKWESRPVDEPKFKAPVDPEKQMIHLGSQQGLQQTQIRFGYPSIRRDDPDYIKMRVANMILGGAFASRLNQRVRDDLGLTYGISSGIDARKYAGDFTISTFTRNDKVGETLNATLEVFQKYANEGAKENELRAAKNLMIGQFPQTIETTEKIAFNLLVLRFFNISDDYLKNFVPNIESVTLNDVNQVVKARFTPEKLQMVIYGDKEKIKDQLDKVAPVVDTTLEF